MNFYDTLKEVLISSDISLKECLIQELFEYCSKNVFISSELSLSKSLVDVE